MCRMVARAGIAEMPLADELLNCPYSLKYLSERGQQPHNPELRGQHKDGCGIAVVHDHALQVEKRDRANAWDKSYIDYIKKEKSKSFIAHNRLASSGLDKSIEGAHPFMLSYSGKMYAFAHNGSVYDFKEAAKARGTSDSLLFFEYLVRNNEPNDAIKIIHRLREITFRAQFSSMTGYLLTPDELMVWRIFNDVDPEKAALRNRYYTQFVKRQPDKIIFSSEPLDETGWEVLPNFEFYYCNFSGDLLRVERTNILRHGA